MKILFVILLLTLSGCAIFDTRIETIVTWENGEELKVKSKSDALVIIEKDGEKATIDNRGRPGVIEQFFGAFLLRPSRQRDTQN